MENQVGIEDSPDATRLDGVFGQRRRTCPPIGQVNAQQTVGPPGGLDNISNFGCAAT
jgi:hypothetical protein